MSELDDFMLLLTKGTDSIEDKKEYYKKVLENFTKLEDHVKLFIVQHVFENIKFQQHLQDIEDELLADETMIKREETVMKRWLFKLIAFAGVFTVMGGILLIVVLKYINGDTSSFGSFWELIKIVIGI